MFAFVGTEWVAVTRSPCEALDAGIFGSAVFAVVVHGVVFLIFLSNVKAHPPLGAGASIERGVKVVVIIKATEQGGS